jgi:L-fuconolactonase
VPDIMTDIAEAQRSFLPTGDAEWLKLRTEEILEPDLPIIDPHHHFWSPPRTIYGGHELAADLMSGHNFIGTVFADCTEHYKKDGPEDYRVVGETEFSVRLGEESDQGLYGPVRFCQAVFGRVDLANGASSKGVLEAHVAAGKGRFKGIRFGTAWDPHPEVRTTARMPTQGLLLDSRVLEGVACLEQLGLVLDLWLYHHQLSDAVELARRFPNLSIVLDHAGGPLRMGPYANRLDEVYADWRAGIAAVASCPNISVKLGGLGMKIGGFHFEDRPLPPSSEDLADAWRPFIEPCIELFGAERAMFESNYPVDSLSCSYPILWNAYKRITEGASASEKTALFAGTAQRVYSVDLG